MLRVTVVYPATEGSHFDTSYYLESHIPMVQELFGSLLQKVEIDTAVEAQAGEPSQPFLALCHLCFSSMADYQAAFGPNIDAIVNDVPNYTNVAPTIQVSEIVRS